MRAAIIGGGIGGLTTAIALRQVGIDSVVFEQATEFRVAGAGLVLWPNAVHVLRSLGVGDDVISVGARITSGQIRQANGAALVSTDQRWLEDEMGAPTVAIHRADLHRVLAARLATASVRLGTSVDRVEQHDDACVAVHLADGAIEHADVVIGADGIHSRVRRAIRPDIGLRYSGYVAWRGVVDDFDTSALSGTSESWGRGERFGIVPIGPRRVYWFATANRSEGLRSTEDARRAELLRRFGHWHAPIRTLIERTPAAHILENDIHDIAPFRGWSDRRAVLLGDAAHPTTPNLGQGACMAIESAENPAIEGAFAAYELSRSARTAWMTEQSRSIGAMGQWSHPLACRARNAFVQWTPPSATRSFFRRVMKFHSGAEY
jgi:2-polyprenyl-6-methoxyphenol hydroxylase-like FAD-dependent oxidoreductase